MEEKKTIIDSYLVENPSHEASEIEVFSGENFMSFERKDNEEKVIFEFKGKAEPKETLGLAETAFGKENITGTRTDEDEIVSNSVGFKIQGSIEDAFNSLTRAAFEQNKENIKNIIFGTPYFDVWDAHRATVENFELYENQVPARIQTNEYSLKVAHENGTPIITAALKEGQTPAFLAPINFEYRLFAFEPEKKNVVFRNVVLDDSEDNFHRETEYVAKNFYAFEKITSDGIESGIEITGDKKEAAKEIKELLEEGEKIGRGMFGSKTNEKLEEKVQELSKSKTR